MIEEGKIIMSAVKDNPKLLELIYKDLAQPPVKKVGQALETVFDLSNTILLPVKLLNEKARLNFIKHMENYKQKLEDIPEDQIKDVAPELGIPIIEKLTYITNEEIADLFTTLLVKASCEKTLNQAHPAFVKMIDMLSVDEARIIRHIKSKSVIPYITQRIHQKNKSGFLELYKNMTGLELQIKLIFPRNIKTYFDNLESLGVISNITDRYKTDDKEYELLKILYQSTMKQFETEEHLKELFNNVEWIRGYYEITNFGRLFMQACTYVKQQPKQT